MAKFATYDAVGNRECLLDVMKIITPVDTKMYSKFEMVTLTGQHPRWQTDTLRAPKKAARVQGATFASMIGTVTPSVEISNELQIFGEGYEVTDSQEAVLHAGRASEVAHQRAKCLKEVARDIEYALHNQDTAVAPAGPATAGEFKGVPGLIDSANIFANGGSARQFTETLVKNCLQAVWALGASNMSTMYLEAKYKELVNSSFGNVTKFQNADSTKMKVMVNVYESDYGILTLELDRYAVADKVTILSDDDWKIGVLKGMKVEPVLRDSLSEKFIVSGEISVVCYQPKASLQITDLKTTA